MTQIFVFADMEFGVTKYQTKKYKPSALFCTYSELLIPLELGERSNQKLVNFDEKSVIVTELMKAHLRYLNRPLAVFGNKIFKVRAIGIFLTLICRYSGNSIFWILVQLYILCERKILNFLIFRIFVFFLNDFLLRRCLKTDDFS